ncbi:MAG: hypothetical protein M0C28_05930 [Candidatus Moduliflexus flocculans]|nr:hypothetical protein [Candidatus Moduliflexus flocculans]
MGQKRPVQVYLLVTEHTIEERLLGTPGGQAGAGPGGPGPGFRRDPGGSDQRHRGAQAAAGAASGAGPDAAIDESRKARVEREAAAAAARRDRVAVAGGQMLSAAFTFMGDVRPEGGESRGIGTGADAQGEARPMPGAGARRNTQDDGHPA